MRWGEDIAFIAVLIVGALAAVWVYGQYQTGQSNAAAAAAQAQETNAVTAEYQQAYEQNQLEQLIGSFSPQAAGVQPSAPVTTAPAAPSATNTSGIT